MSVGVCINNEGSTRDVGVVKVESFYYFTLIFKWNLCIPSMED